MLLEGNQYVRLTNLVRYLTEGDGRKMKCLAELVAMSERNAYRNRNWVMPARCRR